MAHEPTRQAKVVRHTVRPERKRSGRGKLVALVVLTLLLVVSVYNLFVTAPAEQRTGATNRYVDRWFREQIETYAVRACLRRIEGEGTVATAVELSRRAEGRYIVDHVTIEESPFTPGLNQLVQGCIEIGANKAEFESRGHFGDDREHLTFHRSYRFPSLLR